MTLTRFPYRSESVEATEGDLNGRKLPTVHSAYVEPTVAGFRWPTDLRCMSATNEEVGLAAYVS